MGNSSSSSDESGGSSGGGGGSENWGTTAEDIRNVADTAERTAGYVDRACETVGVETNGAVEVAVTVVAEMGVQDAQNYMDYYDDAKDQGKSNEEAAQAASDWDNHRAR